MINFKTIKINILCAVIFCILGVAIYSNTFKSPFQFDDKEFIVNNPEIRDLRNFSALWNTRILSQPSRFVAFYTFAINYHFGKLNVFGYHATNLMIHIINAFLVWWFLRMLVFLDAGNKRAEDNENKTADIRQTKYAVIPFLSALIFLVHPIQTQAVTYISQRFESLAAMLYLSSVCCYVKARLAADTPFKDDCSFLKKNISVLYFLFSFFFALLGMFTKEIVITLPFMIIFIELHFFQTKQTLLAAVKNLSAGIFLAALGFLFLIIPCIFHFKVGSILFSTNPSESHIGDILTPGRYFLTQLKVFATFIRLLFLPAGQNVDYDYPMSSSFFDPKTFFSFVFLSLIFYNAVKFRNKYKLISFGVFWFFIILSVNLIPRTHLIFEHKLYLASIGLFIAFVYGAEIFLRNSRRFVTLLILIIGIFSVMTYLRNAVWKDEVTLWKDILKKSPGKIRPLNNLGTVYYSSGQYDEALKYLDEAIKNHPTYALAYENRGSVYVAKGLYNLALADFNQSVAFDSNQASAYYNRGNVYEKFKKYDLALADYDKAIEIDPYLKIAYENRGIVYGSIGKYDKALGDLDKALTFEGDHSLTYHNRGLVYLKQNKPDSALADINKSISLNPNLAENYYDRANIYKMKNEISSAIKDYSKALDINPMLFEARNNRGILFGIVGLEKNAVSDFSELIKMNPDFLQSYNNLGLIYMKLKEYDKAIEILDKAIIMNPGYASAYFNRALVYRNKGEFQKALDDIYKAKNNGYIIDQRLIDYLKSVINK